MAAKKKSAPQKTKRSTPREGGIQKLFNFCDQFAEGIEKLDAAKDWTKFGLAMNELKKVYFEYKKEVRR